MPYRINLSPRARRDLAKLPHPIRVQVRDRIDSLAVDPRPRGGKKLTGYTNRHRVKAGQYRIVYEIDDTVLLVSILTVAPRKSVYEDG
jgi:mRNA interferase RelE/StbE